MIRRFLSLTVFLLLAADVRAQSLSQTAWGPAAWVWDEADANNQPQNDEPRFFRKRFNLAAEPVKAELWVTADNEYTAFVNGKQVAAGKEWQKIDKIDVSKTLQMGGNVLAIRAQNHGGVAGMIARLWVKTADNNETVIVSNAEMRVSQTPADGWNNTGFTDKDWANAVVLGDIGVGPWNIAPGATAQVKATKSGDVASDGKIKNRLSAAEQIKEFTVPKDFAIELVAGDPLVINPVTLAVDDKGRMVVSESHTYRYGPSGSPVKPYKNPVIRLEPKPDGGFERVLLADGFEDPVMGIAIKGDKMWLTANNYLYRFDYPEAGPATNKKLLVEDKNKAWNPFGMFVIEFGPDGLLYMSVGDHEVALEGPSNKIKGRGRSGVIVRMNPDGTNMENLTQGYRVPYSFEMDPFGQLWVLSNGEGNPNRFVRVIPGVDYHCYTRKIDNNWLAGNHPLAPPAFELPRGAHTQLMRYYGAAYPPEYQGSLFLDNWGAHGFHGPNRAVFRYHPDERGQIVTKESFVSCNDPHFRPAHIELDGDGNMLIADWYGRDDESDLTGRIWRVRYTGKSRPRPGPYIDAEFEKLSKISHLDYICDLASPYHKARRDAADLAVKEKEVGKLASFARDSKDALAAAQALWCLARIGTDDSKQTILEGAKNSDARVRRLALDLGRRHLSLGDRGGVRVREPSDLFLTALRLLKDPDPAVCLEAALTLNPGATVVALKNGAARDVHLRYQAAASLAKVLGGDQLTELLTATDADLRLAGLIAVDVAAYENYPTKKVALAALAKMLSSPKGDDLQHAIFLVQQHGDASMLPDLEKLILRDDLPAAVTGKAMLAYRGIAGKLPATAGKRFLEGVQKGTLALTTPGDHLALIELLESDGPTPFAIEQLGKEARSNQPQVRPAALAVARRFGPKASPLADVLWPSLLNPSPKFKGKGKAKDAGEDLLEALATIAVVQSPARPEQWTKLLSHDDPLIRTDAVRWWRSFKKDAELTKTLIERTPELLKSDAELRDDLAVVFRELGVSSPPVPADDGKRDRVDLAKRAADALATWSPTEWHKHALLGKQVFERSLCTKCHTTVMQNTPLAPSLKGIGTQKIDYLIESILEPSKIIKTGFETEVVVTTAGKSLSGLVKDEGTHLRVQNADLDVRVPKANVEQRTLQKLSIMPAGQEAQLSRREFVDLIAYLSSLK
jgi:quinoprotein glucose dehydrogenase